MPVIEATRKSKGQMLAKVIGQEILVNNLKSGTKLDSIRNLAVKYNVSTKSVQAAFELLEKQNIIEKIPYSGIYIKENKTSPAKTRSIKLLIPLANMNLVPLYAREEFMNLQNGMLSMLNCQKVKLELVPASTDNTQKTLNADSVEPNDVVVVYSGWFEKLFPVLLEKKCKVIYTDISYLHEPYREMIAPWAKIEVRLSQEYEKMVAHLHSVGKRRIVYCGPYQPPVDTSSKYSTWKALKEALINHDIYHDDFYHECKSSLGIGHLQKDELRLFVTQLYKKLKFDAIIVPRTVIAEFIEIIKVDLKLRIPEDIAIFCDGDCSVLEHMSPTASSIHIPWYEIGKEVAAIFADIDNYPVNIRFAPEIKIRESSCKNSVTNTSPEYININHHF